jgi:hypothetical protein
LPIKHTDYERMTTKKRQATMRKAKPVRLTARKRLKKTATLRDLVGAAMDNGMSVEVSIDPKKADALFGKPPFDDSIATLTTPKVTYKELVAINNEVASIPYNNNQPFMATVSPEQAAKFAELLRKNRQGLLSRFTAHPLHDKPCGISRDETRPEPDARHAELVADMFHRGNKKPGEPDLGDFGSYPRVEGYRSLEEVLGRAYNQAASGKGTERHGRGLSFNAQPTQVISDLLDSDAGLAFQAIKKVNEGMRLEHDAKIKEMLGAINYIASIVIRMERNKK